MSAPAHPLCRGCQHIGVVAARVVLAAARANYVRALSLAVDAGLPVAELAQDGDAFARDMARMLAVKQGGE